MTKNLYPDPNDADSISEDGKEKPHIDPDFIEPEQFLNFNRPFGNIKESDRNLEIKKKKKEE